MIPFRYYGGWEGDNGEERESSKRILCQDLPSREVLELEKDSFMTMVFGVSENLGDKRDGTYSSKVFFHIIYMSLCMFM